MNGENRERRSQLKNFWGKNTEESRNNWWGTSNDDETTGTTCEVSGRKVNTFRNVEVSVPLTTDYVVLSKDCSSNPSFIVLVRKLSQRTDLKQLKIQTRTHKIVITPLSKSGEQLKITVNDRPVRIHEDIVLKENGYPVIRLVKEGSQCKVELLNKGVQVIFDGYTCNVELSQVSRKLMCGLCGQSDSEFRTRDYTNTKNFNEFYGQDEDTEYPEDKECDEEFNTCSNKRQWWMNDRTCQKNRRQYGNDEPEFNFDQSEYKQYNREYKPFETEFDSEYKPFESKYNTHENSEWTLKQGDDYETEYQPFEHKRFESEFESEYNPFESKFSSYEKPEWTNEQSDEYETEYDQLSNGKRIVLKHKLIDLENKICVSLQRIPQCPVNTRPVNKIQKRVSFHCVHRNDPRVSKFEGKIHSGERIPGIQRLTPSLTRTVVVPIKCTKSFY